MQNIQKAAPQEIRNFQLKQLKKTLAYLNTHSTFYRRHFATNQIEVASVNSLEDLQQIPPVAKNDLQRAGRDMWCVPSEKVLEYPCTSGTEGKAITVPLTEADLQRLAYNEQLSFMCAGGSSQDIYQLTTTVDRRFMAGMAYTFGARQLGAGMVRVGPGLPQLQWETIAELKPTVLIVVPSFLLKMLEYAKQNGVDFKNSSVKSAICIGEPIRDADFTLNTLGRRIMESWPLQLFSTYASTEMATAFTECHAGKGGHLQPELIYAEILDEEGNLLPSGVPGELVVTTFGVEGLPLLRFRTGDICAMHHEPCVCGRSTPRLGPIIGRKQHMIKYKGTTCYPPALCNVLDEIPEIRNYQIEIFSNEFGHDEVLVRYSCEEPVSEKVLVNSFKAKVRFTPKFEELSYDEMDQLIFTKNSRKPVKILDRRG